MEETLDALVRRVDEDRWLAARFATRPVRERLMALYALNHEIARTAEAVSMETLGDIRLAWWRERIDAIHADPAAPPPAHPALAAYAAMGPTPRMQAVWTQLITAREADLVEAPFDGWPEFAAYVDATAGGVFRLAVEAVLPPETPRPKQLDAFAAKAGLAWGYAGLVRALRFWTQRRRTFLPKKLMDHVGLTPEALFEGQSTHALRSAAMAVIDRGRHAYGEARELASMLPASAFPAIGYLALTPRYMRVLTMPHADPNASADLTLLARQVALVSASAFGKL